MATKCSVCNWNCEDVARWLLEGGFSDYVDLLCKQHIVDGRALLALTEEDLRRPPLQMTVLGDIKRLILAIHRLQLENRDVLHNLGVPDSTTFSQRQTIRTRNNNPRRLDSTSSTLSDDVEANDDDVDGMNGRAGQRSQKLEPEYVKLVISYIYMFAVFLLTAFIMVLVHDKVPDMNKYPPLPDIFLDNMPYVPWAFDMCEVTAVTLTMIWFSVLFVHKHRFILLRRMFSLTGTVFLLRCTTMFITSLSVPGTHLQCAPKVGGDMWSKLERAFVIWRGFGMSLQGVRTCGDYIFSGHTVAVTMLNFFITEYTPQKMYLLHTACWVMNLFGIFFILAAHEHYSIDVFIAFYITSRLFLYYHTLANNRALLQVDHKRTRIWFPLFSFFESKCNGVVPNEYEWPLPWPEQFKECFSKGRKQKAR